MIVHAIPSFIAPSEYGAGNWKAVEATRLALEQSGLPHQRVVVDEHNPSMLLDHVSSDSRHVLIEYSAFPSLVTQLRAERPGVGLHVRTMNAEPFQHLSRQRSNSVRALVRQRVWRRTARLLLNDIECRRSADTLLGISDWDDRHYWRRLPGRAAVRSFPYFSPWPYLRPDVLPEPWDLRRPAIVSMGGNFDPSGLANVVNFQTLADRLSIRSEGKWSFLLTWWTQWHDQVPDVHGGVEILREVSEPWDLLCHVRALAVMTPFGFGLKTTVLDGLAAGCHVIIHSRLATRLPAHAVRACLVFDPDRDDIDDLAMALSSPPPDARLNERLRDSAAQVLRSRMGR